MPTPSRAASTRWKTFAWAVPAAIVLVVIVVLAARGLRQLPDVRSFIADYPGHAALPTDAPVGLPAWLGWQHFLNGFFLILIIRSGWLVRKTKRPPAFWTRDNTRFPRTTNPPKRISLDLWLHLSLDVLWILNGIVFIVLIFATGQWVRIVPTGWDIIPNALSVAIQYASLDWPLENGWLNYNALQVIAYFLTVFVAAPLAIVTGIRMSGLWPQGAKRLNRRYPIEIARAVHFPVMLYFVLFVIVHVTLVLATGALRNLNHMYGSRDDGSWVGAGIFALSLMVMIAAWLLARPLFLRPIASLMGKVSR